MELQIFTDASYKHFLKHPYYSWAYVAINIKDNSLVREGAGIYNSTDHNLGEFQAIVEALKSCDSKDTVKIFTDSETALQYILFLEGNSKFKTVIPVHFNEQCAIFMDQKAKLPNITFHKIKSHSGHFWNDYVDKRASLVLKQHYIQELQKNSAKVNIKMFSVNTPRRKRLASMAQSYKISLKEISAGHFLLSGARELHYFPENPNKVAFSREIGVHTQVSLATAFEIALGHNFPIPNASVAQLPALLDKKNLGLPKLGKIKK